MKIREYEEFDVMENTINDVIALLKNIRDKYGDEVEIAIRKDSYIEPIDRLVEDFEDLDTIEIIKDKENEVIYAVLD